MLRYQVDGMSCGHCIQAVTKAVTAVDPAAQVEVDLAAKEVRVETSTAEEAIAAAIRDAGYEVALAA